jgi:hypothetical protein
MINLALGGDIISDIVGLIVGNIFYYGKNLVSSKYGVDLFPTPNILTSFIYPVKKKSVNQGLDSDPGYYENTVKEFNIHKTNSYAETKKELDYEFKPIENSLKWS